MGRGKAPKILIADDHAIVRAGIKLLLKELFPHARVRESATGDEVVAAIKKEDFDLLILDLNMPDTDSFTLVWNIFAYKRNSRVLIFSLYPSSLYARRLLPLGPLAYLEKGASQEELKLAIHAVINGLFYKNPAADPQPAHRLRAEKNPFEKLSDRELQVAGCIIKGYTYAQMEKMLNLHTSTIATHKFRMYEKLKIGNIAGLMQLAQCFEFDGRFNSPG